MWMLPLAVVVTLGPALAAAAAAPGHVRALVRPDGGAEPLLEPGNEAARPPVPVQAETEALVQSEHAPEPSFIPNNAVPTEKVPAPAAVGAENIEHVPSPVPMEAKQIPVEEDPTQNGPPKYVIEYDPDHDEDCTDNDAAAIKGEAEQNRTVSGCADVDCDHEKHASIIRATCCATCKARKVKASGGGGPQSDSGNSTKVRSQPTEQPGTEHKHNHKDLEKVAFYVGMVTALIVNIPVMCLCACSIFCCYAGSSRSVKVKKDKQDKQDANAVDESGEAAAANEAKTDKT